MARGIYIIGTDTEVGKTVVSAGWMHLLLKHGHKAAYFKPVASGVVEMNGRFVPADAAFVRAVSGFDPDLKHITPYSFADEVAPHLAARIAGLPVDRDVIRKNLDDLKKRYDVIIAEGAGGLMVPLNDDGYMQYELIRELGFPCLLVARAGLGTINHTLLTLYAARQTGLKVNGIVISGVGESPVEKDNILMIKKLSGVRAIFVLPRFSGIVAEKLRPGNLRDVFEETITISEVTSLMDSI